MTIAHFYCAALSFLFGVLFTSFVPLTLPFLFLNFLLASLLLFLVYMTKRELVNRYFFWFGLTLLFFALGGMRVEQAMFSLYQTELHSLAGTTVELEGVVEQEPTLSETTKTLYVKTADATVLVRTDVYTNVSYGDLVKVSGKLSRPEDFETDLGRVFAYTKYLEARGVIYQVEFAQVEVLESNLGNPLITKLLNFKERFLQVINEFLPEPAAGLAAGLVLGVKGALGENLETVFRQSGIIHIVVLSGYNVMLVVLFVMFILKRFLNSRWRLVFGLLAILAFALLVGLSATVVRASVMAALLLIMETLGRTYIILRGLLLAAVIMLLFNPLLLAFDIGFQLSFLATLGLIMIAPYIESKLSKLPNPYEARDFLVATIATQIAVLPLLLYQIGEVSLVAVIVNVLVLPIVPVAMLLILILGVLGLLLPILAPFASYATYVVLVYIVEVASWFASLPFAAVAVPAFPWQIMFILYAFGFCLYFRYSKKPRVVESEVEDLSDWTIVEESELDIKPEAKTKVAEPKEGSATNVPIFFR